MGEESLPNQPRKEIGFHVKEAGLAYRIKPNGSRRIGA